MELGAENYDTVATINRQPSVGVGYLPTARGQCARFDERRQEEAPPNSRNTFRPGLKYLIPYDTTRFVKASVHEVIETLFEAILLVFLVIYVFLQSIRTTIIPAVTIPVSLIGTFALMAALGFSINTLSLTRAGTGDRIGGGRRDRGRRKRRAANDR